MSIPAGWCFLFVLCLGVQGCAEKQAETYLRQLESPNPKVRMDASLELVSLDRHAVGPLIAYARTGGDSLQYIAAQILGQIGDPRAGELLLQWNDSENIYVRREAVLALGKLGDTSHTPFLAQILKTDAVDSLRAAAAQALGMLRDSTAVPDLVQALEDPAASVRRQALAALHYQWTPAVERAVGAVLTDADPTLRYIAAQMLGLHRSTQALGALRHALRDTSLWVRAEAATALGLLGEISAVPDLERLFKTSDGEDHQAAGKALRTLTGVEYVIE